MWIVFYVISRILSIIWSLDDWTNSDIVFVGSVNVLDTSLLSPKIRNPNFAARIENEVINSLSE